MKYVARSSAENEGTVIRNLRRKKKWKIFVFENSNTNLLEKYNRIIWQSLRERDKELATA